MKIKLLKNIVGIAEVHAKGAVVTAGKEIKRAIVEDLIKKGWAEEVKPEEPNTGGAEGNQKPAA